MPPPSSPAIEQVLRRSYGLATFAGIALIAGLVAAGLNGLLAARLAPFSVVSPIFSPLLRPDGPAPVVDDGSAIEALLARPQSPRVELGSVASALLQTMVADGLSAFAHPAAPPENDANCRHSTVQALLVGTLADAAGEWSSALLQDRSTQQTVLATVGSNVAGATVLAIERQRIWVLQAGRRQCVAIGQEPVSPQANQPEAREPAPISPPTDVAQGARSAGVPDLGASIVRIGVGEYQVERAAITAASENPEQLRSHLPPIEQYWEGGRPAGIRLGALPHGSLLTDLGLRRDDILVDVDGTPVTTPQRLVALIDALRTQSRVQVVVVRHGRRVPLAYSVR